LRNNMFLASKSPFPYNVGMHVSNVAFQVN